MHQLKFCDMEDLYMLLAIAFLAFGTLQIILFFKVWAMTSDVKKIKDEFVVYDAIKDAKTAFLTGNANIAQMLLDNELKLVLNGIKNGQSLNELQKEKSLIIETYKYLGLEIPGKQSQALENPKINSLVKLKKTGEKLVAKKYDNDTRKYICYRQSDDMFEGRFREDELIFEEDVKPNNL